MIKPWVPNEDQSKVLKIIMAMTTDSLMGCGVTNPETYTSNLKTYCAMIEKAK